MKARSIERTAILCALLLVAILGLSSTVGAEAAPALDRHTVRAAAIPEVIEWPIGVAIDPLAQTIQVGETMTVAVRASDVVDIGAFELTVAFSPTIVSFVDAAVGDMPLTTGRIFTPQGPTVDAVAGTITFGASSGGDLPKGASGSGPLVILTFQGVAVGQSNLLLHNVTIDRREGDPQEMGQWTDGTVTVLDGTPSPTPTATDTATPIATATSTNTPTITATASRTGTPTQTLVPTETPTPTQTSTVTATPTATELPSGCEEYIENGGFEQDTQDWLIPITAYSAYYSFDQAHSGYRSMRTGIVSANDNRYAYSSFRQTVTIPSSAQSATLRYWAYPISDEAQTVPQPAGNLSAAKLNQYLWYDLQYVLVLDGAGTWIDTLYWACTDEQEWRSFTFDLSGYIGHKITLHFGSYNNGTPGGAVTAMYYDDISLDVCWDDEPTPTATPIGTPTKTLTPTPTATSHPSGCVEQIADGDFESANTGWLFPPTQYTAGISTARAYAGSRSLRTGIVNDNDNRYSYSDGQRVVSIPAGVDSATLRFKAFQSSDDAQTVPTPAPRMAGQKLSAIYLEYDVQYLLLLNNNEAWINTLLWECVDEQQWLSFEYDLTAYAGETIKLQFGTYNTGIGGVTSMYVDDVSLEVCWPGDPVTEPSKVWLPLISKNAQGSPIPPQPSPTPGDYPNPYPYPAPDDGNN